MIYFAIPGDLDTPSGGYRYDRQVIAQLQRRGYAVEVLHLSDRFPWPEPPDLAQAATLFASLPNRSMLLVDGLALGVLSEEVAPLRERLSLFALVHHPLAYETGLTAEQIAHFRQTETAALRHCRGVIVTSPHTAAVLQREYAVTQPITVALPGISLPELLPLTRISDEKQLLCVGALIPRKGHERLIRALTPYREARWHLHCVGRCLEPTTRHLRAILDETALTHKVTLHGEKTDAELAQFYREADGLISAAHYEGFGMAIAESIAYGLPIIATAAGAVADWLPPQAAHVVADDAALQTAIGRLLTDDAWSNALRQQARQYRDQLPSWGDTATALLNGLEIIL